MPRLATLPVFLGLLAPLLLAACADLEFERDTETSGTFTSTGTSLTLLSWDLPKDAMNIARENASDARQANMVVRYARVWPYLGKLDWILDIVSIRFAKISGTWGFAPEQG